MSYTKTPRLAPLTSPLLSREARSRAMWPCEREIARARAATRQGAGLSRGVLLVGGGGATSGLDLDLLLELRHFVRRRGGDAALADEIEDRNEEEDGRDDGGDDDGE